MAAERGVRVFTVGFGTVEGGTIGFEGWSVLRAARRGNAAGDRRRHRAANTSMPARPPISKKVYDSLNARSYSRRKETEITFIFAAIASMLLLVASLFSLHVVQPDRVMRAGLIGRDDAFDARSVEPGPAARELQPLRSQPAVDRRRRARRRRGCDGVASPSAAPSSAAPR